MKTFIKFIGLRTALATSTARLVSSVTNINRKTVSLKRAVKVVSTVFVVAALAVGQVPMAHADTLYTISGDLKDSKNNLIKYAMVCAKESQSSTLLDVQANGSGHYSLEVPAGMYSIGICDNNGANFGTRIDPSTGNLDGTTFRSFFPDGVVNPYVVDASSGNATQDLLFDTVDVDFVIKDAAGTPVANQAFQQISTSSGKTSILAGHSNVRYNTESIVVNTPWTDANGETLTVTLIAGITYQGCTIDITISGNTQVTCAAFTPTADSTINITLPYVEPPQAPTGLSAPNATNQAPALSWNSVSGANHYDIYRDNSSIGSTSSTTYTDTGVSEGSHSYFVKAVNSVDVAGDPSNSKTVIYDVTAPSISYSINQTPNGSGWYNSSVIVTFSCSDALATIATCTSPITVGADGLNQAITGTAVDKAGNTATATATLSVDRSHPTITASQSPAPNANGWNKANVTVSFTCSDNTSGIQSCSSPVTLSSESATLSATGYATDNAGNNDFVTLSNIKIDKTAPTISGASMSSTLIITSANETLSANVSDSLSGVVGGEFYIDTDPGQGNGTAMTYSSGTLSKTVTIGHLGFGVLAQHTLYMRSLDTAGNWSSPTGVTFSYTGLD